MGTFVVKGGRPLSGTIEPQGAKNEALQILCAVLLTAEPVEISNVPDIVDINKLLDILDSLGVRIEKKGNNHYLFQADQVNLEYLKSDAFKTAGFFVISQKHQRTYHHKKGRGTSSLPMETHWIARYV